MTAKFLTAAAEPLAWARARLEPILILVASWIFDHAPIFGRVATRRRKRVVIAPYKRTHTLIAALLKLSAIPIVVFGCLIYGFFFALTAPFLLVPFAVPIVLLAILIIWALPEQRTAPTLPIEFLFPAFFVFLILWPRYLAISLPGMPWITLLRIVGLPMTLFLLISLSTSAAFRKLASESVNAIRPLWIFVGLFIIVQIQTILVSKKPVSSAQLVFDQEIYWTGIFVISCMIFRKRGLVEKYWALLCMMVVFIDGLVAFEWHRNYIPWAAHIPRILQVGDPSVINTLTPSFRPGTHFYRAKGTFATPLALAEYLSLMTPFFIHFALSRINLFVRIACIAMVPITFVVIRMTDARLGVVGVFGTVLLYGLIWSIVRWRTYPRDLFAAATVYAYPAIFLAGIGAIFASHRLKTMVLGGGAQAGSTEARDIQLDMANAKLWIHPWGYGTGQTGDAMGFAKGDFITVDNYFIVVSLDYGLLGIVAWYGMWVIGIVTAVKYCVSEQYGKREEARLLAPLAVTLSVFLLIKWVHGQNDNHSIFFMMLGMISALVYRLKHPDPDEPVPELVQAPRVKSRNQ